MLITPLVVDTFLQRSADTLLLDVRSEKEYLQGHIPGALNMPLLNNEERKIVGTCYKQEGREPAVEKGFQLVGAKFHEKIKEVKGHAQGKEVFLYCWRGGVRSNIMAWVLSLAGFKVFILKGGYKSFRGWALQKLSEPRDLIILGGNTGSGKTEILKDLSEKGEQVIDLEQLADHKGSAFGTLGMVPQTTNEQFENKLAIAWNATNIDKPLWLENESRMIGTLKIPDSIFALMRSAPLLEIKVSYEARLDRIMEEYGKFPSTELEECTLKLKKRLGDLRMRQAIEYLKEGKIKDWADMMLSYYDNFYGYGMSQRDIETIRTLDVQGLTKKEITERLIKTTILLNGNKTGNNKTNPVQ